MSIINYIKNLIFEKKCPNIRCSSCPYFYKTENYNRRCQLIDKLGLNK